jgi:hypothetical protein
MSATHIEAIREMLAVADEQRAIEREKSLAVLRRMVTEIRLLKTDFLAEWDCPPSQ